MGKFLLASSDPDIISSVSQALESSGHQVLTANPEGREIVEVVSRECPDLIVLGVAMPGFEALSLLLNVRNSVDIPAILLTNYGAPKGMLRNLDLGQQIRLSRPLGAVELKPIFDRALDRSHHDASAAGTVNIQDQHLC